MKQWHKTAYVCAALFLLFALLVGCSEQSSAVETTAEDTSREETVNTVETTDTKDTDETAETKPADTSAEQSTSEKTQKTETDSIATESTSQITTSEPLTENTDEQTTEPVDPPETGEIVDTDRALYTYDDLQEDLAALAADYESLFSYRSIGQTHEGREIYAAVLGNPNASKQVLIVAGLHARESLSSLAAMKQVELYLRAYDESYSGKTYRELFDTCSIQLVPMANPDGVMLTAQGMSSLRTESAIAQVTKICKEWGWSGQEDEKIAAYWKSNAMGVDLNRNYPTEDWEALKPGVIAPSFSKHKGSAAGSESETQALMAWVEAQSNAQCLISYHTAGHVLYWDCGQTVYTVRQECLDLAQLTKELTNDAGYTGGYKIIYDQNRDASLTDWCVLEKNLPAITVEMGDVQYPAKDSDTTGAVAETRLLFAALAMRYGAK